jgi:hypothetical protein
VTLSLRFVQSIKKIDIHGSYSIQYYREGGAGRLHPCPSCQPLPQSKSGPRTEEPTADPKSTASAAHPSHPSPSIKEKTKRTNVRSHSPLDRCCPSDHSIHFPSLCDTQMRQVLFVRALSQLMGPRLRAKYHSAGILYYACVPQSIRDSQPGVAVAMTHKLGESQAKCRPLTSLPNPRPASSLGRTNNSRQAKAA